MSDGYTSWPWMAMSPISISSSLIRSGTKTPTSLSRMKVPTAEKTITQSAVNACHLRRCRLPVTEKPGTTSIEESASTPTSRPPMTPAKPWV